MVGVVHGSLDKRLRKGFVAPSDQRLETGSL